MSHQEDRLGPTDAAILDHLSEQGLDYPEVIAVEGAVAPDRAARQVDTLASRGLVEQVSPEVVYRVTDRGERRLATYYGRSSGAASDD
jgi:DNA-binding MarR family transcriptional regulator